VSTEQEAPNAWIGETVYVGLLVPAMGISDPAITSCKTGTLHQVTSLGILGTFADQSIDETPMRVFYPWNSVLFIANTDEVRETRKRR
jgi:hypothetical protein